jgi:hypothetical protein
VQGHAPEALCRALSSAIDQFEEQRRIDEHGAQTKVRVSRAELGVIVRTGRGSLLGAARCCGPQTTVSLLATAATVGAAAIAVTAATPTAAGAAARTIRATAAIRTVRATAAIRTAAASAV